jgi:hypothetical protein
MSSVQRPPWSESEKVNCSYMQAFMGPCKLIKQLSQIALLIEIAKDAQVDPVLSLARALPVNGPEPRWEEIPLPAGTPRCIYALFNRFPPVEACHRYSHALQALADSMNRAKSKIL